MSINATESITLEQLENSLKRAIENGLQLAIFNSCDGLELANSLLRKYHIPQLIVMREPIPDQVAQAFLKYFLNSFSRGHSLSIAMREAREKLQGLEDEFPFASWLPVLFQHPAERPATWSSLRGVNPNANRQIMNEVLWLGLRGKYWIGLALISLMLSSTITILALNSSSNRSQVGDAKSYGEEVLGEKTWLKDRASQHYRDGQYLKAAQLYRQSWMKERRDPETLIYMNNSLLEAQNLKYYTLAVAISILKDNDGAVKDVETANEFLQGVAQFQTDLNLRMINIHSRLFAKSLPNIFLSDKFKELENSLPKQKIGLKIVIFNDENSFDKAESGAINASRDPSILGIVGHYTSEMTLAAVDIYNRNNLALVSPGTTTTQLSEDRPDNFFRTVANTKLEAQKLADQILRNGYENAAIFYTPSSPFSASLVLEIKDLLKEKLTIIDVNGFDLSRRDFNPVRALSQLTDHQNIAIVLIPDGKVSNARINAIEMIEANNDQYHIFGTTTLYEKETLNVIRKQSLQKISIFIHWHPDSRRLSSFPDRAKKLWGSSVIFRTAHAYDAAHVLLKAFANHVAPNRQDVIETLSQENFSICGVTGPIQFEKNGGDRHNPPAVLVQPRFSGANVELVPIPGTATGSLKEPCP